MRTAGASKRCRSPSLRRRRRQTAATSTRVRRKTRVHAAAEMHVSFQPRTVQVDRWAVDGVVRVERHDVRRRREALTHCRARTRGQYVKRRSSSRFHDPPSLSPSTQPLCRRRRVNYTPLYIGGARGRPPRSTDARRWGGNVYKRRIFGRLISAATVG